jgi:putative phosphoribosyl transferase
MIFSNREDAGHRLAAPLLHHLDHGALVLGLLRGGVVVAREVARAHKAPLDVWVVRKIGAPLQPELAIGAIAEGGGAYFDESLARLLEVSEAEVAAVVESAQVELDRRIQLYRRGRPPPLIEGRTVILVDDGLATGSTARAALVALRAQNPARLVLAVPVAAADSLAELSGLADEVVCLQPVTNLRAIGEWYVDFAQVSDEEVMARLGRDQASPRSLAALESSSARVVVIDAAGVNLAGDLAVPEGAAGLVVFAHGSGSSRRSARNRQVAEALRARGLATLLFDLLTPHEEAEDAITAEHRFDIALLAARLVGATDWALEEPATRHLAIGYFGASTGAAAALVGAVVRKDVVRAVVSRGGRPDLAGPHLERVEAPTLLIVGGRDREVLRANRAARKLLRGPAQLAIVPGATHLFEEPGALDEVAHLAEGWLTRWIAARSRPVRRTA